MTPFHPEKSQEEPFFSCLSYSGLLSGTCMFVLRDQWKRCDKNTPESIREHESRCEYYATWDCYYMSDIHPWCTRDYKKTDSLLSALMGYICLWIQIWLMIFKSVFLHEQFLTCNKVTFSISRQQQITLVLSLSTLTRVLKGATVIVKVKSCSLSSVIL